MPKEKAVKIMKDYVETGFNKGETLRKNGYSEATISSNAGATIETASDKVKKALDLDRSMTPDATAKTVLQIVGYSGDDVLKHYRFIVEQERDLPSKLKALAPLLKALGVSLDSEPTNVVIPTLNIGIAEVKQGSIEPPKETVSHNQHCG